MARLPSFLVLAAASAVGLGSLPIQTVLAPADAATPEVARPKNSTPALNYTIHCSGCHKPDGSGEPKIVPDLRSNMAKFLALPEGRAYLVQVPGSSQSLIDDKELAELLNHMVRRFDPTHLPRCFQPYTEREIAAIRRPALSDALAERARLIKVIDSKGGSATTVGAADSRACRNQTKG